MPGKKTVKSPTKTVSKKATRPGKNGGRLKAGPGPGRPRLTDEQKELNAAIRSGREMNAAILKEMIDSGKYRDLVLMAVSKQATSGRIDGIKWLVESVEPEPQRLIMEQLQTPEEKAAALLAALEAQDG